MKPMRNITEQEEQIIRLVHHEFGGLSRREAAAQLNMTQQSLSYHLRKIEKKVPQLFPILTQLQWQVFQLFQEGKDLRTIAGLLCQSDARIESVQQQLLKKGFDCRIHRNGRKMVYYDPSMDSQVKEKF